MAHARLPWNGLKIKGVTAMFKRIFWALPLLFLIATFASGSGGDDDYWTKGSEGYANVQAVIPAQYQNYEFFWACDFGFIRNSVIPFLGTLRSAAGVTGVAALGWYPAKIAGYFAGAESAAAWNPEAMRTIEAMAAAKAAQEQAYKRAAVIGWVFAGLEKLAEECGYGVEWIIRKFVDYETVDEMAAHAERIRSEPGISDYYVFAITRAPDMNDAILQLGAWMKVRILPEEGRPLVLRFRNPRLNFRRIGARVWERDVLGDFKEQTVQCVFAYEKYGDELLPSPEDGKVYRRLRVFTDSPEKGGIVDGSLDFGVVSEEVGSGGLREIHLCSLVNEGLAVRKLDDFFFAIVLTEENVEVSKPLTEMEQGGTPLGEIGKELAIPVHIKGFHTGRETARTGPFGEQLGLDDIGEAVFKGCYCTINGKKVDVTVEHDAYQSTVRLVPASAGRVDLVLQNDFGPSLVIRDIATITYSGEDYAVWFYQLPYGDFVGIDGTIHIGQVREFMRRIKIKQNETFDFLLKVKYCETEQGEKYYNELREKDIHPLMIWRKSRVESGEAPVFKTLAEAQAYACGLFESSHKIVFSNRTLFRTYIEDEDVMLEGSWILANFECK
jgi:hypothetical protein